MFAIGMYIWSMTDPKVQHWMVTRGFDDEEGVAGY